MRRATWQRGAIVAIALMAISVAGCGSNEKTGASATPSPATGESTGSTTSRATAATATKAGAAGGGSATPVARRRVVFLGTSLTAGLGLDPEKAFVALLQRKIDSAGFPITLVNAGLSGETSAGALRRAAWVLDQPSSAVVLEVGANDGLRGVDPDSTKANIVALIKAVRTQQPNAAVLLVQMEAPTNLGRGYTTNFHLAYTSAAKETNTPLLPFLLDGVAGVTRLNQADGIHPNIEGSVRVATSMWNALLPTFSALAR